MVIRFNLLALHRVAKERAMEEDKTRKALEEYMNGLTRHMLLSGLSTKALPTESKTTKQGELSPFGIRLAQFIGAVLAALLFGFVMSYFDLW